MLLLLHWLLLLLLPPSSATFTQPLRCRSIPPSPLPPASDIPNPYITERAMLGSFPDMRPSSVTPHRCVRPPVWRHSNRIPRESAPHDCTLMTSENGNKRQVCSSDVLGNCSSDNLVTF